jgi:hypothetical protein
LNDIVRAVQSHGGELAIASAEGLGTTVSFWLPNSGHLHTVLAAVAPPEPSPPSHLSADPPALTADASVYPPAPSA